MSDSSLVNILSGNLEISFDKGSGGLPSQVYLLDSDGERTLIMDRDQRIEAELADGTVIHPVFPEQAEDIIDVYELEGTQRVDFCKLLWADEQGKLIPDFYLMLRHEFMEDGTAFTNAFFTVEQNEPVSIRRFEVIMPLKLNDCDTLKWAISRRPNRNDGAIIQSIFPERFLNPGENKFFDHEIFPNANFCCRRNNGPSFYVEMVMEGTNTIGGTRTDNCSAVDWEDGNPVLRWNFQTVPTTERWVPLHWNNRWGWVINHAPVRRHLPPMQMYHHFDLAEHLPTEEELLAAADAGCDLFIIHENWRLDLQNDGMPYDMKQFRKLVKLAHDRNIRIALYMRGREININEDYCSWFRHLLKYNFDGLYMDYGCPMGNRTPPDETFQNGRILFRSYYLKLKKIREMIGPDAVFYSHTGPLFCAVGLPFVDGYISGEGERGVMIKGRLEHEYFSMAYAANGTMWTAAFPEYSSPRMTPFLAATGQYPHSPLGIQFPGSSLIHPPVPGVNDLAFRPLWKLWSCFRNEKDITIFNNYNCRNIFQNVSSDTGCYLMVSRDCRRGLLVVSNFRETENTATFSLNMKKTGLTSDRCLLLAFDDSQAPVSEKVSGNSFSITLPPYGVAALLFSRSPEEENEMTRKFFQPYPALPPQGRKWLDDIEKQRALRSSPPQWPEVWLKAVMPFYEPLPYEDSMALDLYNETIQLGEFDENGEFHLLGWIGHEHFTREETPEKDKIHPGRPSCMIPLHSILPPGKHRLATVSYHLGAKFYSFLDLYLSSDKDGKDAYKLEFRNELEPDRALMRFSIDLRQR